MSSQHYLNQPGDLMKVPGNLNGGKTGAPPGMLQDDCRKLSRWLASRPGARRLVKERCREIEEKDTP